MRHTAEGYWLAEAGPPEPLPALGGDEAADFAIVGGGFTGMWAAWFISAAAPGARVVLLERGLCGHGPSGRNGGFANTLWLSLPNLRERFGGAAALAVARASAAEVHELGEWCEAEGVDAWYRRAGYLQVSASPAQDGAWEPAARAARELGEPQAIQPLSASEVAEICRSPAFRGGALYPDSATVQPARLALGLRARLAARGVRVFERTPVRALREEPGGVRLETPGGSVRAAHAVLGAGGALAALRPLRLRLTVTSSHMVITEPVPDLLEEIGWTGGECITDSRAMVNYFRTTPDGRIAFGWGGGRIAAGARLGGRAEVDPEVARQVVAHLRRFFPGLAGRRIEHAWGGPIDVSPTHLPVVGSLASGRVHYAFGYTGNGVGPSRLCGRCLASLALERRDEASRLAIVEPPPVRVPPEPLRYVGGALIREALVRKEAAEDAGRRPALAARLLSELPRLIGIHIGR